MENRFIRAVSRVSFGFVSEAIDIFSMVLAAILYVLRNVFNALHQKVLDFRIGRGLDVMQFEQTLQEWQIYNMALNLRVDPWERGKEGLHTVWAPKNYPELSKRQAYKVLETYRAQKKILGNKSR